MVVRCYKRIVKSCLTPIIIERVFAILLRLRTPFILILRLVMQKRTYEPIDALIVTRPCFAFPARPD